MPDCRSTRSPCAPGRCRVTAADPAGFRTALDGNRQAIDEAAQLRAACLVLVVGGLPPGSRDLAGARARVAEALEELVPYARQRAVRLALEPLHPLFCAERSVLSTLAQALALAGRFAASDVGVVVDAYHVWWDPGLGEQLALAGPRIASLQVCDWITPLPADVLLGRGMMGDGHIDLPGLSSAVDQAGYRGDVEVEIFNSGIWNSDPERVLTTLCHRYQKHISPHLS